MKLLLKIVGGLLVLIVVLVVGIFTVARFHDGPLEIISGGAFTTGEQYTGTEPDWSFVHDIETVEFQLLDPDRSRTTWIVEHEGRIFIPSGYMNSLMGKIWKHWPMEAEKDGRILLRVNGVIYQRQLVRVMEGDFLEPVLAELGRKYMGLDLSTDTDVPVDIVSSGSLWLFELKPR